MARPREIPCTKPVKAMSRHIGGGGITQTVTDPRFNDRVPGTLSLESVGRAYSFVNDIRSRELKDLKKRFKKGTLNEDEERSMNVLESHEAARRRFTKELDAKKAFEAAESQQVAKTGKKPFFYKMSGVRKLMRKEQSK